MHIVIRPLLAAALLGALAAPLPALAHSLESLQADLRAEEDYFEEKDQPAPDFSLQDPDGDPVRLDDFPG